MNLEETLGDGWKQVMGGLGVFLVGAIWGGIVLGDDVSIPDMYIPLVLMMLGALVAILGMSLDAGGEHGQSFDLRGAVDEMTDMLNDLQGKLTGGEDGGSGDSGSDDGGSGDSGSDDGGSGDGE